MCQNIWKQETYQLPLTFVAYNLYKIKPYINMDIPQKPYFFEGFMSLVNIKDAVYIGGYILNYHMYCWIECKIINIYESGWKPTAFLLRNAWFKAHKLYLEIT